MTELQVRRYTAADAAVWNAFVAGSRNGTFLFDRGFMDYHADRFDDHSLLVYDGENPVALLPAHREGDRLASHRGLTYGGFVIGRDTGAVDMLGMFDAVLGYLRGHGIASLLYKTVPTIYHTHPAEEDRYALFRRDASLVRRDILSVVPRADRIPYRSRRARGVRIARKAGVRIEEAAAYTAFWPLLTRVLHERHGAVPVHTIEEIERLRARFPDAIRLFVARLDDDIVAGTVVFESLMVAHAQYIAADARGRATHALDLLFATLLEDVFRDRPWFDFGISNEHGGRVLNEGLVTQKEGFGARAVVHDHYELQVS